MKIKYSITITMVAVLATIFSIPAITASEHTEILSYDKIRTRNNSSCLNAVVGHPKELLRDRENHAPLSESFESLSRDEIKSNIISVTRSISVNYPARFALDTLWNIHNLERYEPKVISAHVQRETDRTGAYTAWGFFGVIPWRGTFSYILTDTGFTSELLNSPIPSIQVKGGFLVNEEVGNQCQIIHYEKYMVPQWLSCMVPLIKNYVHWSMGRELNNIITLISQAASSHEY